MSAKDYADGIAICKILIAVAPMANPRFNHNPKMVLQKLNNVAVAMQSLEALGISTGGINTKDVVDGDEKQIMNILRSLHLYSRREQKTHSRRQSVSASSTLDFTLDGSSSASSSFDGAALAAAVAASTPPPSGSSASSSGAVPASTSAPAPAKEPEKARAASPVVVAPSPSSSSAVASPGTVKAVPQQQPLKRAVVGDNKIGGGAAKAASPSPVAPAKPVAASAALPKEEELKALDARAEAELRSLDEKISAMNRKLQEFDEVKGEDAKAQTPGAQPPKLTTVQNSGSVGKKPSQPPPPVPPAVVEESSTTEGEEDSDDEKGQITKTAQEQLRQWQQEKDLQVQAAAQSAAQAEVQAAVKAEGESAADATPSKGGRVRRPGRRRKKKASRIKSSPRAGGQGSEEDDSGISDSPDASDDEPASPSPSHGPAGGQLSAAGEKASFGSTTSSPVVPKKPDAKARSKIGRNRRRGSTATAVARITSVEQDLNAVSAETAELKAERQALEETAQVFSDQPGVDVSSEWYVSPLKIEELNQMAKNAAFAKGVVRMQALVRGKEARRKRKLLAKRKFIAREVVESERTYVRNLGLCIDHFYEPMSKLSYISDLQLRQMFSEISVIRGFNAHLCGQLEKRQNDWAKSGQKLGDIFLGFVAYFRSYTAYVNNYNDAMALFYSLQAKNKSFQAFLAEKKVDPHLNGQELPAFLIMPIQRLPRYVMLLEDLLRNTPKDHPDFVDLTTALSKVQSVADYVNEKKREAENVNLVLDVQSRLSGMGKNLAEPHRRFVRQGEVMNADRKGETMLFLFNDILITAKQSHGLGKLTEKGKEMLGFAKKGSSTPKMARKAQHSPFFGKKKPQLQAEVDESTYKYRKTIALSDCKVSAMFATNANQASASGGTAGGSGGAAASSFADLQFMMTLKTPTEQLHFGLNSEEELVSWLHDFDSTAMRLVERKRLRCERTAKHHDGSETFLVPTAGRHVVNKADASYTGRVMMRSPADNEFISKYICLVKPHLYVFNDADDEEPEGWLYLLTCHAVMNSRCTDPPGWSFSVHVPYTSVPSASNWMSKHALRVKGQAGNASNATGVDKDVVIEEDADRYRYDFIASNVNEVLHWCREIRNVILDSVKLPDDLCPLEVIQRIPDEGNKTCADCGFEPTTYASVNLGVFLCAACAELHDELLPGISIIRSIKDPWDISAQHRFELEALMGNTKRNKIFEKNAVKKDIARAKPNDGREARARWIKAKYVISNLEKDPALSASFGGSVSSPGSRRLSVNSK